MKIDFDPDKDMANRAKHQVSLAFGAHVLADSNRLDVLDVRFDYAEDRFVSYRMVENRNWVCVYARRDKAYRMISVKKANGHEKQRYHTATR